jgi:hypothetical protein
MIKLVENAPKTYARIAGVTYLIIIAAGMFGVSVRERLIVSGDAAATANNIVTNASLFRLGIAADLSTFLLAIPMTLILYALLKPVNRDLALLTVMLNVAQDAIGGVNVLNTYRPLQILGGAGYLNVFSQDQLEALSLLSLNTYSTGFFVAMLFFGVCCVVLGYLIFKATFIPKPFGVLIAIAGLCYVANTVAVILSPAIASALYPAILLPPFVGELAFALWLTVKGIDVSRWKAQSAVPA